MCLCPCCFQLIRDLFYCAFSVVIIIYSFKNMSNINEIKDLDIKTNFTDNYVSLSLFENNILKEANNKYIEFFNKLNLKEGDKLTNNDNINNSINRIYRINLTLIIFLIILIIPTLVPLILLCTCELDPEGIIMDGIGIIAIFIMKGKFIILFILLWIFVGFNINYKNIFENEFFELYYNINNGTEKNLFENYYQPLFELKFGLLINIILLPVTLFYIFGFVFLFYDPSGCLWKRCYN